MKNKYKTTQLFGKNERVRPEVRKVRPPGSFRLFYLYLNLGLMLARLGINKLTHPKANRHRGAVVKNKLEGLGGLWIKLGQMIAMRTDIYHKDFCDELSRLQDSSYAFDGNQAMRIIEKDLGKPIWSIFSEFDKIPIAAASLAQVHSARLIHNKQKVVVKVQKPYSKNFLRKDLDMIKSLFAIMSTLGFYKHLNLKGLSWEFNQIFAEELDFRIETVNLSNFRKLIKSHGIYSPKVYKQFCSKRIVVMEFIEAVTMTQFINMKRKDPARLKVWLRQNKINPKRAGEHLILSVLRQLFEDNIFHGDLHPGNIMLLSKGKVALIDLGSVGSTDQKILRLYKQHLECMENKEYARAAEFFIMMSPEVEDHDLKALIREISRALRASEVKNSLSKIAHSERAKVFSDTQDELNKTIGKYKLAPDWSFLKFGRAFATLEHTLAHLDPKMNFSGAFKQYAIESARRNRLTDEQKTRNIQQKISTTLAFVEDNIRKKSIPFSGELKKGTMVLVAILRFFFLPIWFTFGMLIWGYLYQHYNIFIGWVHDYPNILTGIIERIPKYSEFKWIVALVLMFFITKKFHRFFSKIAKPTSPE